MESKENTGNSAVEARVSSSKAAKKPANRKSKAEQENAWHPPTGEMVSAAIKELKDRKGSSLQAIKKYVTSNYNIDGEKFSPYIKKYLKSAVTSGTLVQTKGNGASGSFKLSIGKIPETSAAKKVSSSRRKSVPKKRQAVAKASPNKAKKAATEKETATAGMDATKAIAKPKASAAAKNMSKTKRNTKAPAAKTKTPKAKRVEASRAIRSSRKK